MAEQNLQGGCSCGRNQYEIVCPSTDEVKSMAQVFLGDAPDMRRSHGSLLPILLRVPLPWLQSTTYAYTKDERPLDIKRVFSPHSEPQSKRNFCGFCGTPLTYWTEGHPGEADFICVNVGSLERNSVDLLEGFGLFPVDSGDLVDNTDGGLISTATATSIQPTTSAEHQLVRSEPCFEELIQTGPLGRLKRRRRVQKSRDGYSTVEWEVLETEASEAAGTPKKRQVIDIMMGGENDNMKG